MDEHDADQRELSTADVRSTTIEPTFMDTEPSLSQLDPAVTRAWIIGGLASAVIVSGIVWMLEWFWLRHVESWALPTGSLSIAVGAVILFHDVVLSVWRYRTWRYAVRDHDVLMRFGVFWRTHSAVPRPRIQHVDVTSGLIERAFGLATLKLYTAGTGTADARIPGLTRADAQRLQASLLERRTM